MTAKNREAKKIKAQSKTAQASRFRRAKLASLSGSNGQLSAHRKVLAMISLTQSAAQNRFVYRGGLRHETDGSA